jgi:hypothetical protein
MAKCIIQRLGLNAVRFQSVKGDLNDYKTKVDIPKKNPTNALLTRIGKAF